ncbi:hypothetical protein IFM89_012206 [Coptis chinensis]|uniref:PXMP2/4 family protein 4 n=1 Tax=Coptis chinensis TaxID=261450 RepID=A0A835HM20_9MAGN|nr:hypothetical protein IFM89_012206 [Coptis chinensis]
MSSSLRSSKSCLHRLLNNTRSTILFHHQNVTKHQQLPLHSRPYYYTARSPLLYKQKPPKYPSLYSFYRSYSSSSSSSSLTSKNGFIGWYLGMLESRPILTKSITSSLIYTFADLSSQAITGSSSDSFDLIRTSRMAGYGMLVMGPSMHFWFNFISKVLPKRDVVNTLKKLFMGQTIYGPIMTTIFFSVNAGLQGENGAEIIARLKRDLLPTLTNGLMYWPICDFVTFKFIPVRLQPLVSNSFAYLWTIYITYMATLEKADSSSISSIESAS